MEDCMMDDTPDVWPDPPEDEKDLCRHCNDYPCKCLEYEDLNLLAEVGYGEETEDEH
jgi:hypothetical protein